MVCLSGEQKCGEPKRKIIPISNLLMPSFEKFLCFFNLLFTLLFSLSFHSYYHFSGRNRYCIDKNYASVFILWDRLFGTFAPEGDKIHFGLTHPVQSFDPSHLQLNHYRVLINRVRESKDWRDKMSVIFKGPGWEKGKPRLGFIQDIPDVTPDSEVEFFDPPVATEMKVYTCIHFFVMLFFHVQMMTRSDDVSQSVRLVLFSFIFTSLTSFASIMEGHCYAEKLELFRCWFFVFIEHLLLPNNPSHESGTGSIILMTIIVKYGIKVIYFSSLLVLMIRQLTKVGVLQKLTSDIRIRMK